MGQGSSSCSANTAASPVPVRSMSRGVRADRVVAHAHAPRGSSSMAPNRCSGRATRTAAPSPEGNTSSASSASSHKAQASMRHHSTARHTPIGEPSSSTASSPLPTRTRIPGRGTRADVSRAAPAPHERSNHSGLGIVPPPARTGHALHEAGFGDVEIAESNVLAHSRWPGLPLRRLEKRTRKHRHPLGAHAR